MHRFARRFAKPTRLPPLIRRPADHFSPKAAAIHNSTAGKNGGVSPEDKNNNTRYERRRKVLPPELSSSPNVVKLTCDSTADGGVCDVYLVGTSHVSTESCQEVKAVIDFLKPQAVFLELCESRRNILLQRENLKVPTMKDMREIWMDKNQDPSLMTFEWQLAKVAHERDVIPGAEFRVAWEEARKYGGEVFLGDRPIQITAGRTQLKSFWNTIKRKYYAPIYLEAHLQAFPLATQDLRKLLKNINNITDEEMLKIIEDIDKRFPGFKLQETCFELLSPTQGTFVETFVHERDQWMSHGLLEIASTRNSVVAVVGMAHLPGIQKNWKKPVDIKQLRIITPTPNTIPIGQIIKYVGVAVAGVAILILF